MPKHSTVQCQQCFHLNHTGLREGLNSVDPEFRDRYGLVELNAIAYIPPTEAETNFYQQHRGQAMAA